MSFVILAAVVVVVLGALALFTALVAALVEMAVPPSGTALDVDGATIRYLDEGTGPPIVLLHGLAGNLRHFTYALVDRLKTNHRVIALDRPGCGHSKMAPGAGAGLEAQAGVIVAFMDALGLERPLVMGHSLGGALALAIAVHHRDRVGGLALVAPISHPRRDPPPPFRMLATPSPLRRWLMAWTIAVPANLLAGSAAVRYVFGPDPVPKDFGVRGGGFLALIPRNFRCSSAEMVALRDDLPAMVDAYPTLALPVGILYGTHDRVLDHKIQGEALAASIQGAILDLIPGGGHMSPVVMPERTAAFVEAVAARVSLEQPLVRRETARF